MRLPLAQGCRICVCARADIRFANRIAVFQIERAEITYERQARLRNLQPRLPFFYACTAADTRSGQHAHRALAQQLENV